MKLKGDTLILSERNLLMLLTKLYTKDSACEIVGDPIECPMHVKAEKDDAHYGERKYPAGRMHPVSERLVKAVREASEGAEIK